jgi:hypothetical protein
MPDHIVALGILQSLYKGRETCTTMGNMGGFSLSNLHFLLRGNHVINLFGENIWREVVGRAFSSSAIELWSHGYTRPPSLGVEARKVGARG